MVPLQRYFNHKFKIFLFIYLIKSVAAANSSQPQKYFVFKEAVNWYQALINCKSAGMELVSIHSEAEQNELELFMNDKNDQVYWLGATKEGNGQFYWLTGHKMVYTKWLVGQPDNAKIVIYDNKGEYCLGWGTRSWPENAPETPGWNDLTCTIKMPYICQRFDYCVIKD
ncbi:C-type lectin mannose-binding isoform-like [Euwallacea fornicatus]|uniref:C-type lectin mannose-binding isoform-like n=1 Tax=Euwallacea fornicatus TaxID=995702 RepID=UPI00338F87A7